MAMGGSAWAGVPRTAQSRVHNNNNNNYNYNYNNNNNNKAQ